MSTAKSKHTVPSAFDRYVSSNNSGSYNPGPIKEPGELETVQTQLNDLQLEEFADGPYGAATNAEFLGKSSPWKSDQRTVSAFRDANPMTTNRRSAADEPEWDASRGRIEGEN